MGCELPNVTCGECRCDELIEMVSEWRIVVISTNARVMLQCDTRRKEKKGQRY